MITKKEALKELAKRELARRRFEHFTTYVDPFFGHATKGYVIKEFHRTIINALERVLRGELKKVMVSVPPQHGKSTISSQRFPLFAHHLDPTLQIALASYSSTLSSTHLSKARQIINSENFKNISDLELIKDSQVEYTTKQGGVLRSVGVSGSLTGMPVDLMIIDDCHKDRAEYESTTMRNAVWDWYTSVVLSRLHNDSSQVLVMTRWGEDDLFGRIMELEGDQWEVINIPVEFEDTTIFPERFPLEFIQQKRKVMGERDYQSLYMGDPLNEGGGDFKRDYFDYYNTEDVMAVANRLDVITFLDPAISKSQEADSTAIVTIGIDGTSHLIYILQVKQLKAHPDEIIDELFDTADMFRQGGKSYRCGIEVVQYQKMLALEVKKQMRIRDKHFLLEEVRPQGEKEARIRTTLQPRYSTCSILHPKTGNPIKELENELLKFPNGKHDDLIDALSGAVALGKVNNFNSGFSVIETDNMGLLQ